MSVISKPLPGVTLTGDELLSLACDFIGFSWRIDGGSVTVLHRGQRVTSVPTEPEARYAICEYAIGMIKREFEDVDIDIETGVIKREFEDVDVDIEQAAQGEDGRGCTSSHPEQPKRSADCDLT